MGLAPLCAESRLHISRGTKVGEGHIQREQGPQEEATALHNPRGISDHSPVGLYSVTPQSMSQKGQLKGLDWFHLERLREGT